MSRYIFRGKRKDNGEWVYGMPCATEKSGIYAIQTLQGGIFDIIPETLGQCTGLTDKNIKDIFEGDIVHYLYEPGKGWWNCDQHSVIEWNSTGFYMRGIMGTNKYACSTGWLVSIPHGNGKCFAVIGNIHDNPELLGGF